MKFDSKNVEISACYLAIELSNCLEHEPTKT